MYWKTIGPKRFRLNKLFIFGGEHVYTDDIRPSGHNTVCKKMIKDLMQKTAILAAMIIISHLLIGVVPIYLIVFQKIRVTVMGLEIPFFEPSSDIGYAINLSLQYVYGIVSMGALMMIQIGLNLCYNNGMLAKELVVLELSDMQYELSASGMSFKAIVRLRNILMKIQDLNG